MYGTPTNILKLKARLSAPNAGALTDITNDPTLMSILIGSFVPKLRDDAFLAEVGRRLQNRREELGLTQEAVCQRARISPQQLSKYELGQSDPPLSTLLRITSALSMSATALLVQTSVMDR